MSDHTPLTPEATPEEIGKRAFWFGAAGLGVAVTFLLFVTTSNGGPPWTIDAVSRLMVNGRDVPDDSLRAAPGAAREGDKLVVQPGGILQLSLPEGSALLDAQPGAAFTLPAGPSRWVGRACGTVLAAGEMRVTTGSGFSGSRLHVDTPVTAIDITSGTVSLRASADSTTICMLDGRTQSLAHVDGTRRLAEAGSCLTVTRTDGAGHIAPMPGDTRAALLALRDAGVRRASERSQTR